ncbi:hypothetical protein DL546_001061 [Coniochaeta pulveracea]|uniref:Uncharacterized protein n=1 Tax=Coniochaeta pulveracea TaxID=177199 RepID=A0A420YJY4_9PEZI|nr:hypothetical protein DL546_001061 [Coniochaeta pulveracea]
MPHFTRPNEDGVRFEGLRLSGLCHDPFYADYQALNGPLRCWPAYVINPTGVILNLAPGELICRWSDEGVDGLGLCGRKAVDLSDHNLHLFNSHVLPAYGRFGVTLDIMKSQAENWNSTMIRGFYCQLMGHAFQVILPGAVRVPHDLAPASSGSRASPLASRRNAKPQGRCQAGRGYAQPSAEAIAARQAAATEAIATITLMQTGADFEDEAPPRIDSEMAKQSSDVNFKEGRKG